MLSGVVGVEAQFGYIAFDAGVSPGQGPAVAIKFYSSPYRSAWFVAFGYYSELVPADLVHGSWHYSVFGTCGGYRWRVGSGWDISFGIGPGYSTEKLNGRTHKEITLYGEIAFGYSF